MRIALGVANARYPVAIAYAQAWMAPVFPVWVARSLAYRSGMFKRAAGIRAYYSMRAASKQSVCAPVWGSYIRSALSVAIAIINAH
jgi:hypothetical protein